MSNKTKDQIIEKIKQEIPFIDVKPFSHNIISLELRLLEEKYGEKEVYNLINSTDLKYKGWGHIVLESDIMNGKYNIEPGTKQENKNLIKAVADDAMNDSESDSE